MKFQDVKFTVSKCKHEIFVRIDMKHSYFSNYFIICLQSIFLLFVVCQKFKSCLCIIFSYYYIKNKSMYLFIEIFYNLFAIIFSVVEIIIELFVVC